MPSRQSIPRIRVDLLNGSPHSLSSSSTLDIRDILSQVKMCPNLLTEGSLDDVDDALRLEDSHLEDVPSFPMGRKPPLFILHSHRVRLPFPIRQEAFELGDFCGDEEDACPLLTSPTIPRMKLMIKEQLYLQKWVDTLTLDNPPKHIPWSCEKPVAERKWIAEGSIFPADRVKSEHRAAIREHLCVIDTNRFSAHVPHSGELCALSEVPAPTNAPTESHASTSHVLVKSAEVSPGILRGESHTRHSIVRTSQTRLLPTLLSSGLPILVDAPLAARRGRSLSGLKLKGSVMEQLEYPDIPTAFRGSPSVWSPRFDVLPAPSPTDHQSMLLDLKLKCAALGSGVATYVPESLHPHPEMAHWHTSLDVNEWIFTRGLATSDSASGLVDGKVPQDITIDPGVFLPNDFSTPAKGPSSAVHPPRLCSTPTLQSPVKRSSDPPTDPLPPRPALVNPSTPPYVRGILKKAKSVRFEDLVTKGLQGTPPITSPQASPERPHHLAVSSGRPCTPMPNTPRSPSGLAPATETLIPGKNAEEKKPVPRSRLPPKRTKASGKFESINPIDVGNSSEQSKSTTTTTTSVERPCRIAHAKKSTSSAAVPQTQAKPKGLSVTETDVRRGIEGATKSRLSTPLRNIFRFR